MKLIYGLLAIGSFYAFYRFQLNRQLTEEKAKRLQELDDFKTKMYTNITHEFRTPLTVIQGMAGQLEGNHKVKMAIQRNSFNLLNLVNQMLDLSKLESGNLSVNMIQGDVINYLSYLTESFQSFAKSNNIRLHFLPKKAAFQMDYDPGKLKIITANLLSNAIKFNKKDGDVYIEISVIENQFLNEQKKLFIKIKDTGIGISKEQLSHIFERFYQADATSTRQGEGTGIGLAFTKELVKLLKGIIEVESTSEKGTTFSVKLPVTNIAPFSTQKTKISKPDFQPEPKNVFIDLLTQEEELPIVLIVEDNADVRDYLASCLDSIYQLAFAVDGKKGIDKALQIIPDVIISDVMMPQKDGYELCEILKKDVRTSHIPIILLTAKADINSKLFGLHKGADAYLSKPFNKEELFVRLEQLIMLRKQLQQHFQQHFSTKSKAKRAGEKYLKENAFIQKAKNIILENIEDETFDTAQLCTSLGISGTQLYRKLKALTGKSTALYIRSIRLQKANELLHTTNKTVSEIAYQTGFKEVSYFSYCFSAEFGMSPSKTRE